MTKAFVTGSGSPIEIGRELGKGGEGTVYEVPAHHNLVAKIYNAHHLPDAAKQAKLRFMATTGDAQLLSYAAWPRDTLHRSRNGAVIGFLMPRVSGRAELHELYSPAHRRQDYPDATWKFLGYVARNTAAAMASMHGHGHVIGDVNQKNFLFGKDSKVVLIDCDSYQINAKGELHLCKVGTSHFTPPELQAVTGFDTTIRTCNHDCFGLALLIFHLLFGGRHPYSGVPLRADAGEALEKDIQAFRYAYAPDCRMRGFNPPPNSIALSVVPQSIQAMFTAAFTESGAKLGRPTAEQWVGALDGMLGSLQRCRTSTMHVYSAHLNGCPWCALEDYGVVYFLGVRGTTGSSDFVLARVWSAIEAVPAPPAINIPSLSAVSVTPKPLPPGMNHTGTIALLRVVVCVIGIALIAAVPAAWFFILGGAWFAWAKVSNIGAPERKAERARREAARDAAWQEYNAIKGRIDREVSQTLFATRKRELARLRNEYQRLSEREKSEIADLHRTAEARQRQHFLERHYLDGASIAGVGPAKKAALRSFGIETAADVTWDKVMAVKGFGEALTRAVVDWRKACDRRFVFNPQTAVTEADKNAVRAQIANRSRTLESALNAGAGDLQRLRQEISNKTMVLEPLLKAASGKLVQAEADLNVL